MKKKCIVLTVYGLFVVHFIAGQLPNIVLRETFKWENSSW